MPRWSGGGEECDTELDIEATLIGGSGQFPTCSRMSLVPRYPRAGDGERHISLATQYSIFAFAGESGRGLRAEDGKRAGLLSLKGHRRRDAGDARHLRV